MLTFFHHINEGATEGRLFHHRWFWKTKKKDYNLEISTGLSLRLEFQRGEAGDCDQSCQLTIGLVFFTIYFTFPVPKSWLLQKKCTATWDNNREFYLTDGRLYGFYFYNWAFVWHWHARVHESRSSDPWWMSQYIHLDEKLLGRKECVLTDLNEVSDIYFKLGEKEFKINSIKWTRRKIFRTFIPFALWHRTLYFVEIKIDKPPMRSGKGENSWDCGDDGIFGMSALWKGAVPTWRNAKEIAQEATKMYVDSVLRDARKYGGSSGQDGIKATDPYQYIGRKLKQDAPNVEEEEEG